MLQISLYLKKYSFYAIFIAILLLLYSIKNELEVTHILGHITHLHNLYFSKSLELCNLPRFSSSPVVQTFSLDLQCPRYVCVPTNQLGGLGHRLSNLMQTFLISKELGLPILAPELEPEGRLHGAYAGANDLFSINFPLKCPLSEEMAPFGWTVKRIGLPFLWKDFPYPGFASQLVNEIKSCNTIYLMTEFWPHSMESVRPLLRKTFQPHSLTGMKIFSNLLWNTSTFNIAIHSRLGDIRPTPIECQVETLKRVLKLADPQNTLPIHVWIFSESPNELILPLQAIRRPLLTLHTDTNIPALNSFVHLLESDVFIGSDSSFSWFASYLSDELPLVLSAPNLGRESPEFENFMSGNIRVDSFFKFNDSGRLVSAGKLWRESRFNSLSTCQRNPFSYFYNLNPLTEFERLNSNRLSYIHDFQKLSNVRDSNDLFGIAPTSAIVSCNDSKCNSFPFITPRRPCTVFILGNDFIAKNVSNLNDCALYHFDCSFLPSVSPDFSFNRFFQGTFYKRLHTCIDDWNSDDGKVKTLINAMKELNVSKLDMLFINQGGIEHKIVRSMKKSLKTIPEISRNLPYLVFVNMFHTSLSWLPPAQQIPVEYLGDTFLSLAEMGYFVVSNHVLTTDCPYTRAFLLSRVAC